MNSDLFLDNVAFVRKIVKKMDYGYIDADDLYQAGLIGLYKASKCYNKKINNNFLSYASIYIISEIKNELRNNKLIILNKKVLKVKKYINNNKIENKSIDEIASELNVDKEIVFSALEHQNDITSLNEVKENEELLNYISNNDYDIYNSHYKYCLEKLDYLSKEVIIMKYYKNYSQSEIAKILKCSQSTISRIEKNALAVIKRNIS